MFARWERDRLTRFSFLLLPNFSMMALSAMLDPLRMANWLSGETLYEWVLLSRDGEPVRAVNGVSVSVDRSIGGAPPSDMIMVSASYDHIGLDTVEVVAWLRRMARFGTPLGAQDNGTYVLARAGVLDGYRATAHWEMLETYTELFPEVEFTQDLFVIDRDRVTAAGGTSGLDLMLTAISQQHGRELATRAADEFVYARIRNPNEAQRLPLRNRLATGNPRLIRAVEAMEAALEDAAPVATFAEAAGVSERELERMFRRWLKTSPGAYYRRLRLERARALLQQTEMPVIDVAVASGFGSAAHFSRAYRARYGRAPSSDRASVL